MENPHGKQFINLIGEWPYQISKLTEIQLVFAELEAMDIREKAIERRIIIMHNILNYLRRDPTQVKHCENAMSNEKQPLQLNAMEFIQLMLTKLEALEIRQRINEKKIIILSQAINYLRASPISVKYRDTTSAKDKIETDSHEFISGFSKKELMKYEDKIAVATSTGGKFCDNVINHASIAETIRTSPQKYSQLLGQTFQLKLSKNPERDKFKRLRRSTNRNWTLNISTTTDNKFTNQESMVNFKICLIIFGEITGGSIGIRMGSCSLYCNIRMGIG